MEKQYKDSIDLFYRVISCLIILLSAIQFVGCKNATINPDNITVENDENIISEYDREKVASEPVSDKQASDYDVWVESMAPIYTEIEGLEEPIRLSFEDGFSCTIAKEQFSEEYLESIEEIKNKIDEIEDPSTELKETDTDLIEILDTLSVFIISVNEKIDEKEYPSEDEDFHVNYVLTNMESGWEEIDSAIEDYKTCVNFELKNNISDEKKIELDFSISETITAAVNDSNVRMLTIFAEDYFPNNRWQYSYFNELMYADTVTSWKEARQTLNNDAFPICQEMNNRFSGTFLNNCCALYDLYLQDYSTTVDFALNATADLNNEARSIPTGAFERKFRNWVEPYVSAKSFAVLKTLSNGDVYEKNATDDILYERSIMMGLDPLNMFSTCTVDQMCESYIRAAKDNSKLFWSPSHPGDYPLEQFYISDSEYEDLMKIVNGQASKDTYENKLTDYQRIMNNKIEIFSDSYQKYSDELTVLTSEYNFDIFEAAGLF